MGREAEAPSIVSLADTFATGTAAGFATELFLYPLEHPQPLHKFTGISMREMAWVAGTRAPSTGLLMASYEFARVGLVNHLFPTQQHPILTPLVAGLIAVCAESLVLAPLVAIRESTARKRNFAKHPLRLLSPFPNIVATTAPFVSLYYAFSDFCIDRLKKSNAFKDSPSWVTSAVGGAIGGSLAILGAAPIEVARVNWINRHQQASNPTTTTTPTTTAATNNNTLKWKLVHQSPRFAFRRAFFGIIRSTATKGLLARGIVGRGVIRGAVTGLVRAIFKK
ncbi:hypothetical protein BDR26DRAFT_865872 [Obelidium mucronatum]|nr:hypothetical protein BDR26DRAFT_865872 [Obelidium mucronatum]